MCTLLRYIGFNHNDELGTLMEVALRIGPHGLSSPPSLSLFLVRSAYYSVIDDRAIVFNIPVQR